MASRITKGSLSISLIVGTLLVPLSALAAIWLAGPGPDAESTLSTESPTTLAIAGTDATTAPTDISTNLEAACGADGMALVALEDRGDITEVQQAALDALRDLCEQESMPLPAASSLGAIVQTVVVPDSTAATTATTLDERDDDHREDEHEEEHEDEREHEGEREHEDEHGSGHDEHEDDD